MASKGIKGITIEIGADTTGLDQALKKVNKTAESTATELKQVERMLKFDPSNTELLAQKQAILADQISNTSEKLKVLKTAQSQVQEQFDKGDIGTDQYRAFQRELIKTESYLESLQDRAEKNIEIRAEADTSKLDEFTKSLDELSEKAEKTGEKMQSIGGTLTTSVTAPIAAFGTTAIMSAGQFDNAAGQIQSALGVTAEEAERLEDVATSVWKQGFGESLDEVSSALIRVQQNMKEISSDEIEGVTRNALTLAKVFESDVNEVTRGANNLMVNFGLSSKDAFDLLAKGAQSGLNFSNELFDNVAEYSGLFANMGYTAEEYFDILARGSEAGVYNLDYLNDAMKEFQIRIKDGSDATSTAFADMTQETQDVWDAFYYGKATVKDVADAVIKDLQSMEDQTYAGMLGVTLFGTKWEDLESSAMYAMLGMEGGLESAKGAMDALAKAQEQTFGQRWESFTRTAAASLEPLGQVLLDLAEEFLPKVVAALEKMATWFSELSPDAKNLTLILGGIAAAAGPVIAGIGMLASGIGAISGVVGSITGALGGLGAAAGTAGASAGALGTTIGALSGPIGWTALAIAGIGTAAVVVGKEMSESSLQVEEWSDKVSESTAEAVGGFLDLSEQATLSLNQLAWSGTTVTEEMASNIVGIYNDMGNQVLTAMQEDHAAQLQTMTDHFANSSALTETEEAKILAQMQAKQAEKEAVITEGQARINEIMNTAKEQKRIITEAEQAEINAIHETMKNNAIQYMTESQAEQKVILETLKAEASTITAEQAAQVVQNSVKQKEEVVAEAQDQYEKSVAEIIRQRDEMGVISAEQAEKLIEEAQKQRDETVSAAEDMHGKVVKEAKEQADEHVDKVNWETGEIKSKWVFLKDNVSKTISELCSNIEKGWNDALTWTKNKVVEIKQSAENKFNEMKNAVETKMSEIKTKIQTKWNEAVSFLKSINLSSIGKEIINGLIKGISDKFNAVRTKIESLASSLPKWTKKVLGIASPSKVFMELGEWVGIGLADGIESTESLNEKMIEKVTSSILDVKENAKKELVELEKKLADDIAEVNEKAEEKILKIQQTATNKKRKLTTDDQKEIKKIRQNAANDIAKLEKKAVEERIKISENESKEIESRYKEMLDDIKSFIDEKKSLNQMSLKDEALLWQESVSLFEGANEQKIVAQKAYRDTLEKLNNEIVSVNESYSNQILAINENLIKEEETLTQAYEDELNKRATTLSGFANIFDAYEVKVEKTGIDLINNLRSQVVALNQWRYQFESLSKRGILSDALLDGISEMGVDALDELIELNKLTDIQLTEYSNLYEEKMRSAREQAEKELEGTKNGVAFAIAIMREKAEVEMSKLEDEWAEDIRALTEVTETELLTMEQIGKNAGQGLLNGLSSMESSLKNKAKQIADNISKTIKDALQVKSPSRVMIGIGENVGEGLIIGMDDMLSKVSESSSRLSNALVSAQASMSSSSAKSQASQVTQQQIYHNQSIDMSGLIQAISALAQRPIQTTVSIDRQAVGHAVSDYQYKNASLHASMKGMSL